MTYDEFISNIIETRGQWNIPEGEYYEIHHIIPKCKGGLPKRPKRKEHHENLIWLTGKEHYTAHKLLAEENPDDQDLQLAWLRSAYDKQGKYIPAERYEELKSISIVFTEEHKNNISINHADVSGSNNPMYGKGYLVSGSKNGRYGKEVTQETRDKISKVRLTQVELNKQNYKNILNWRKNNPEAYSKSQSRPGSKNGRSIAVRCIETGEEFECIKYAKDWLKSIGSSGIKKLKACCENSNLTTGIYHWEYVI